MIRFYLITSFLLLLSGLANATDLDLSFNKTFYWPNCGAEILSVPAPEVDSYWIDSWTADGDLWNWYTPEKYDFIKGDIISTCMFWIQTPGQYDCLRYDGFYFCGEEDWRNYIAYGWHDFGYVPPGGPYWGWLHGIFFDTQYIPDRFLPLNLDWASKVIVTNHWFVGGLPLNRRPDCFTIEK